MTVSGSATAEDATSRRKKTINVVLMPGESLLFSSVSFAFLLFSCAKGGLPMPTNHEFYTERWSSEVPAFVRVLKALPGDQLDYKPHEKNTSAGDLAWQLALEQGHLCELLDTGVINFEQTKRPDSADEIVATFVHAAEGAKA